MVDRLITFPDIEKRKEAFLRLQHQEIIGPGAPGPVKQIIDTLVVKSDPRNEGMHSPLHFLEHSSGQYLRRLQEYFRIQFGSEMSRYFEVYNTTSLDYARKFDKMRKSWPNNTVLWNELMHVPNELQAPIVPTCEDIDSINLSGDKTLLSGDKTLQEKLLRLFSIFLLAFLFFTSSNVVLAEIPQQSKYVEQVVFDTPAPAKSYVKCYVRCTP